MTESIDYGACLMKGLVGGIGAIPATCGSHPFDVLKIRMQVKGDPLSQAIQHCYKAGGKIGSPLNFYRGFFPAIEQRMITRGPMFLCSELYTQFVFTNTNLSKTQATYVGSCGSGFTTGFLAGLAEYRKKLLSQSVITSHDARWDRMINTARANGTLPFILRRLVAAGCCSATYDSAFFGTQVFLATNYDMSPGMSYGCAAVAGVLCAFAFDTAVARMMVIPPGERCDSFLKTVKNVFAKKNGESGTLVARIARGYRGLSARSVEFFINYSIVGATSVYVTAFFAPMIQAASKKE